MSPLRALLIGLLGLPLLACSGFSEGFKQGFDKSFRQSFVDSCAAERTPEVTPEQMTAMCECGADGLLKEYSATELMKLSTENPEIIGQKAEPIMTACAKKVILGEGAEVAPTDGPAEMPARAPEVVEPTAPTAPAP